jgi:hypothetical protein
MYKLVKLVKLELGQASKSKVGDSSSQLPQAIREATSDLPGHVITIVHATCFVTFRDATVLYSMN